MLIEHHLPLMQFAAGVHAHRIVRDLNLPACERADVCQDLLLEMFPRFSRFDPSVAAASTFVDVLARHAAHAVRNRYRRRAAHFRRSVPLDLECDDANLSTTSNDVAGLELAMEVQRAVSTLPRPLRSLVDLLMDGRLSEARHASGLSYATFYRRLRAIRLHFLSAGLHPAG